MACLAPEFFYTFWVAGMICGDMVTDPLFGEETFRTDNTLISQGGFYSIKRGKKRWKMDGCAFDGDLGNVWST